MGPFFWFFFYSLWDDVQKRTTRKEGSGNCRRSDCVRVGRAVPFGSDRLNLPPALGRRDKVTTSEWTSQAHCHVLPMCALRQPAKRKKKPAQKPAQKLEGKTQFRPCVTCVDWKPTNKNVRYESFARFYFKIGFRFGTPLRTKSIETITSKSDNCHVCPTCVP